MATGNRLLICVIAVVILSGLTAAFVLEWCGKPGASAFVGVSSTALGVLCPSPFKTAHEGKPDAEEEPAP